MTLAPSRIKPARNRAPAASMNVKSHRSRQTLSGVTWGSPQADSNSPIQGSRSLPSSLSVQVRSLPSDRVIISMTSPRKHTGALKRSLCHMPSRGPFGRRKSLVGWEMIFLRRERRASTAVARREDGATTRRGDYEGSWVERERPSFFSRLRSVLG